MPLTQHRANELFMYDPETGVVTRKVDIKYNAKKGQVVGSTQSQGYMTVSVDGEVYLVHRLIWIMVYGYSPELLVDHINGDKSDNRLINLREASYSCNSYNSGLHADSSTGVKGVHFRKRSGKWTAYIQHKGKRRHLGEYSTLAEAARARAEAEDQIPSYRMCKRDAEGVEGGI